MKNKEKYDLREIEISKEYLINGCGKKIETPYFINIYYKGNCLVDKGKTSLSAFAYLMYWLEEESEGNL